MKKELYYIRGNAERADEVKAALLEKYPDLKIDSCYTRFTQPECLYYNHNGFADYVKPSEIGLMDVLTKFGTELHLSEESERPFEVGDVVTSKDSDSNQCQIVSDTKNDNIYVFRSVANGSNVFRFATDKEIDEWNKETLCSQGLHYSKIDRKIIYLFNPFEKVLVRDTDEQPWRCNIFSHYLHPLDSAFPSKCRCIMGAWVQCIPYNEKTAHLVGTTEKYEVY